MNNQEKFTKLYEKAKEIAINQYQSENNNNGINDFESIEIIDDGIIQVKFVDDDGDDWNYEISNEDLNI